MPVITPNIPEGLIELMKTFAKCVLKEKPENIYEFSVVHFENLLQERDGSLNKGYERFAASEKYLDAREQCLMSQITSHLNKKSRPDPLKIPPNDGVTNAPTSETLSPKSLQNKFRPRKLSSRKASEALLSIKEEDEGHNPSEELAAKHRKLTAARRIQRAYKSYTKRKEQRENGAALVIQRALKKLFGSKLGSAKALQNDRESTCSNIQNDSGVESDVPKDETESDENRKELNVGVKKYMDIDLTINSIITQQVPSFTEDERRSPNLETDKAEESSVGNLVAADTVVQKEKSVDSESSVHMGSNIESSPSKQVDIEETQLNDQSGRTEDIAEVDATKDANPKLDQDYTIDEEEIKAEILKDVEEPLKTDVDEAGKLILEREGRFVSNDTNNIRSAELVSDVHHEKSDDIKNKANGFPEAILEEVAKNGSKNDISKETIEFVKSPRENEDGKQNEEENSNDKNGGKNEVENELNNDEKAINDKKQEENEEKLSIGKGMSNDIEEDQPQLNLIGNEDKNGSQDNIQKEMEIETRNRKSAVNDNIDVNGTETDNEVNKDEYNNLPPKKDEDSVTPKSVWYVGSEPIITSKSTDDEPKSSESINNSSNEKSEPEKGEQDNNSTITDDLKSDPKAEIANSANENTENNGNDSNQENIDINIENNLEMSIKESEAGIEKLKPDELTSNAPIENEKTTEGLDNELSSKDVESDNNVADEGINEIKNEQNDRQHADADEGEKDHIISGTTENSIEKLKNAEEKQEISEPTEIQNNEIKASKYKEDDEGENLEKIIPEETKKNIENLKNEEDAELLGKDNTETSIENLKSQEISGKDAGRENNLVEIDEFEMKDESGSKHAEDNEDDQTVLGMAENNPENLKNELEISSVDTGSDQNIKGATEIQNEETGGNKNIESYESKNDQIITENEMNLDNIKNDEEIEKDIGSDNKNILDEGTVGIHNEEINSSEANDGDKDINIPKISESSIEILKNSDENLNTKSSEEAIESTNDLEIQKASQEVLKNRSEEGTEADKSESHNTQGKALENEVGTEASIGEANDARGNEENANNDKVSVNKENLSSENKSEGKIDSKNEASKIPSEEAEEQNGAKINRTEVIEEEIKKVVAPSRYANPGKSSIKNGKDKNSSEEYNDSEGSEDKIIAKELLQHASDKEVDALLKDELNKCEEQAVDNDKTETKIFEGDNKTDQNSLTELTDATLESNSTESNTTNQYSKSDEEKVESKSPISSKRNLNEEKDEAEIKKQKSESLNLESPKIETNEVELNETNENNNGIAKENLNDKILESGNLEKGVILESDIKEDKKRKQKEEKAFEGFIIEPAFKDNDGGNTGVNPDNTKKDSTETSEAVTINEEQGTSRPQVNVQEVGITETSLLEDDKQNDINSEDKNEVSEVPQETKQAESCQEESNIDPLKDDNKFENKSDVIDENKLISTQAEKQNINIVETVAENSNTMDINNPESTEENALIKSNEHNNIIQEQEQDVDDKHVARQNDPQKTSEEQNAEINDLKNENDLEISDDNKKLSLNLETNEDESTSRNNDVNNKDTKNIEVNTKQIEEKEEIKILEQKTDDIESEKYVNINAVNEVKTDDKAPIDNDKKEESLKEKEGNLKSDDENNFENTTKIMKESNEENELKTSVNSELEKQVDKIELVKLNVDHKSETIRELTENENTDNKDESDEEDTEFSQNTVEENQFSEVNKSTSESNRNSGEKVDTNVETKDSEKETKTTYSLDKTEIAEIPLEKIDEQQHISVENSEKKSEEVKIDKVRKEEEEREEKGEEMRNQIKDKQDINSLENITSDSSQQNAANSTNGTNGGIEMGKTVENNEIQNNLKETKDGDSGIREQNPGKTNNQEPVADEETKKDLGDVEKINENQNIVELQTGETKKDLDDEDKNNENQNIVQPQYDETNKDLDDLNKNNENQHIVELQTGETNKNLGDVNKNNKSQNIVELQTGKIKNDLDDVDKNNGNQNIVELQTDETNKNSDEDKNNENQNIVELQTDETNRDLNKVDKNNENQNILELQIDETNKNLDDVGKNNESQNIVETKKDLDDVDKNNEIQNILELQSSETKKDLDNVGKNNDSQNIVELQTGKTKNDLYDVDENNKNLNIVELQTDETNKNLNEMDKNNENQHIVELQTDKINKNLKEMDKNNENQNVVELQTDESNSDLNKVDKNNENQNIVELQTDETNKNLDDVGKNNESQNIVETKPDLDDVDKNNENQNIVELQTHETNKNLDEVGKNYENQNIIELQTGEPNKDLDDVDKNNENQNVLDNIAAKQVTKPEKEDSDISKNEKLENLNILNHEKEELEKKTSKSDNIVKEVEKDENSKKDDTDINIKESKHTDNNVQLNKTYTISKNQFGEKVDNSEENPILKRQTSSSSILLNALLNEKSADNEVLPQKFTEISPGEQKEEEVEEEQITKQIIPLATTSEAHSEYSLDKETSAKNENSTEKSEEMKTKFNAELTAEKPATTFEILSTPLSDAETTRAESRSTINDELSEIENIDISTYGEDSLEAMYYSLRKNEIMLDRMQKRASERKSASKERGPFEKLDLRQVKSMSEMGRSMSVNSDDDVVIKTLERNKSNDNDLQESNNPISVVAQNAARLLEAMHQINSNPVKPSSSSFEEDRVVRPPCRIYSPSIRMKSRIPTPIKDFPKSVSFETPLALAQRKSQKFMQRLHDDSQSSETLDSLLDQKETSDTIRQKMLAYSVSEADSDCCVEAEKKMRVKHDDSNVSTALETASTDTDSTIVSAATKIQAGARGFLTRRRLRRASEGALPQESERKASFGNEAIGESLEDLVEQNAASKIQKSYRRYLGTKQHKSESSKPSPETSSSSKSSDGSKPVGITQVKIGQKRDRANSDDAKKVDDIDDGYHGAYFEGLNLAERRMTLQRGDAVQKYSTPEEENGFSITNDRQLSDAGDSKPTTSPKKRKPVNNDMWRNFGLRQRTMPVQIESDILRIVPKHMRKRIKSADVQKKSR